MGYTKAFVPKWFVSFQLFHADERFQIFFAKGFWNRDDLLHDVRY